MDEDDDDLAGFEKVIISALHLCLPLPSPARLPLSESPIEHRWAHTSSSPNETNFCLAKRIASELLLAILTTTRKVAALSLSLAIVLASQMKEVGGQ